MKTYLVFWGDGYITRQTRVVSEEFFCEDQGYSKTDIAAIRRLEIGRLCKFYPEEQYVIRIRE